MATLGSSYLTLADAMKRTEDGKTIAKVIEILSQNNPMLDDIIAVECNQGTKHTHTVRSDLPSVTWGGLYKGIGQSKSRTAQVSDTTGFAEALSTIDTRLLKMSPGNEAQLRMSEAMPFYEAFNQEMASGLFYHDTATSPEKFKGLCARYNTLSNVNVIDGGGAGADNTSIWIVCWGENYTSTIYPSGFKAGIEREDKGEQRILDAAGNPFYAKEEEFRWHMGVAVKDWRFNVRIANIDISEVQAGNVDLFALLRKAYWKLPNTVADREGKGAAGPKKFAIYCNRDIMEALDAQSSNQGGGSDNYTRLKMAEIEGKAVEAYRSMPIRNTDALLNTEAEVV